MNHFLFDFFLCFFILSSWRKLSVNSQCVGDCENCITPKGERGQCVTIKNCPQLLRILSYVPIRAEDANLLRDSNCGFQGIDPKVCCSLTNEQITTPPPATRIPLNTGEKLTGYHSSLLPSTEICGVSSAERILGGEETELDEFPWMALLQYTKPRGKGFHCGGVLISNRYVLTAAHCVKGKDLPRTWTLSSVRLGEYNTETEEDCVTSGNGYKWCSDKPIDIPVEERIAHEKYQPRDPNQYNDIALLRLSRAVNFTDYIKPVCLPTSSELINNDFVGTTMYVAGWGKTENSSDSPIKLKLKVPVKRITTCAEVYRNADIELGPTQMCAGGESGKDSCRGDSGGPLMGNYKNANADANWYALGLVSFGPSPCGTAGWPGIYTKINDFVPWIVNKLKP
ncbi:CLIP domain-containing serine protease 2 [Agrilus planipennis]|uniref:CLIP domain-containing serine protease n=1 Tax=Agrilus planipennis TaxID=224129 RepID=A0A1W4XI92_AGRPL|nr:CLIP domain-containing serine protease 2 [Agrilus planipennis]